jgi:[acyl-carrier-protein] S-malonyltransferase
MCGDPTKLPRYVQVLYEIASSILDYDLLDLCANGPQEKLNQTIYSQPAILVSSLAALERF